MSVVDRDRVAAALPGYTVGAEIGAGAFGTVLRATHMALGRDVAVKVLADASPRDAAAFLAEARAVARLDHPHVVRVHDYVTAGDLCLLVMELLEGGSLARRRLPPRQACAVGLALADALVLTHGQGILHRDIKPGNILVTGAGQPKLTDFGIAKILEGSAVSASQIIGTPRFMPPEQLRGERLSAATDLYALSASLYELASGTPTVPSGTAMQDLVHHQLDVMPPPPPGVPDPIAAVLMRGLARSPRDRHADALSFAADLAAAATRVFGAGWLPEAGFPVVISDELRDLTTGGGPRSRPVPAPGAASRAATPPAAGVPARPWRSRAVLAAAVAAAVLAGGALGGGVSWAAAGDRRPAPAPGPVTAPTPPWQQESLTVGAIRTVVGNPRNLTLGFAGDGGPAQGAQFLNPQGIAVDPARGYLYIVDRMNNRVRRVDARGIITTVAGTGAEGFSGDGGPATAAQLSQPTTLAVAPDGSFYIADSANYRVRKVDTHGVITTVAGTGDLGFGGPVGDTALVYAGDGAPATQATVTPESVAVDGAGNLYIGDANQDRVRRVDTHGVITTVAGTGGHGYTGDGGPATTATFRYPKTIALGPDGSLYVADLFNERIRKITPQGVISTIAGNGEYGNAGDGGPALDAQLDLGIASLAVDRLGNVYVTSQYRLRRIDTHGTITTVAGTGQIGLADDGPDAARSHLVTPAGLAAGDDGLLYILDAVPGVVRVMRVLPARCTAPACPTASS